MSSVAIINLIAFALGIFASYLILVKSLSQPDIAHKLLSLIIFSSSWILIVVTFNFSKLSITFPHFFRTGLPFCLIIPPASYLYVQTFFKAEKRFKRVNLLHFLPALILFLDLLPFYLQDAETKKAYVIAYLEGSDAMYTLNEGFVSSFWVYGLIGVSVGVYLFLQILMIYNQLRNKNYGKTLIMGEQQQKWLLSFTAYLFVIYVAFFWVYVMSFKIENMHHHELSVIMGVSFLFFMIFLYQKPEILYNLESASEARENCHQYMPFNANQLKNYCQQVLQYIEDEEPFLKCGYSLENLASDTCISRSHLSIVLNKGLGIKYNDLINKYRVEYLIHHYTEVNKQNLTIEGIATNIGFKSRTTFLHSVKKITGLTPSEFLRKLEENDFAKQ